jgi:hypothetical protein
MGDKSWIYSHEPEAKQQSHVEAATITKSKKGAAGPEFNKEHAHFFFDIKGIVHHEFVPPNNTVNSDFYCHILRRLRESVG